MSFYSYRGALFNNGLPYRGYGATWEPGAVGGGRWVDWGPSPDLSGMGQELLAAAMATVPPGATVPLSVLIRQASEIERSAEPYLTPGAPYADGVKAKMESLSMNREAAWNSLKAKGQEAQASLATIAQQFPSESMVAVSKAKLIANIVGPLSQEISSLIQRYIAEVPPEIQKAKDAKEAAINVVVAEQKAVAAQNEVKAAVDATSAFVANTKLDTAMKELAKANVVAHQTATATARRPLLIAAAVAVPILGIIIYTLTKKRSSSVAGYRRRRRSRRSRR